MPRAVPRLHLQPPCTHCCGAELNLDSFPEHKHEIPTEKGSICIEIKGQQQQAGPGRELQLRSATMGEMLLCIFLHALQRWDFSQLQPVGKVTLTSGPSLRHATI